MHSPNINMCIDVSIERTTDCVVTRSINVGRLGNEWGQCGEAGVNYNLLYLNAYLATLHWPVVSIKPIMSHHAQGFQQQQVQVQVPRLRPPAIDQV